MRNPQPPKLGGNVQHVTLLYALTEIIEPIAIKKKKLFQVIAYIKK